MTETKHIPWIAIDLDGTVADCSHRLHHIIDPATGKKVPHKQRRYDLFHKNSDKDLPIKAAIDYIKKNYPQDKFSWVFITGRPDTMRMDSFYWIMLNMTKDRGVNPIFMRKASDMRPDEITKRELMEIAIETFGCKPIIAFDDREGVIKAWRELGVEVFDSKTFGAMAQHGE